MAYHVPVFEHGAQGHLEPMTDVRQLETLGQAGHQHAGKSQQDERRPAPDDVVGSVVKVCDKI